MENNTEIISENKSIKRESVKKNYLYNLVYQIFVLVTPLITTPYVSRVLLADGIGKYSFSLSLITYFTLFAALGFGYYAQREIAKHQADKIAQTIIFWEINICRLLPVMVAIIVNILLYFLNVYGDYSLLMLILSINIISVAFDINYLYQGNERFKAVVIRNIFIRALAIASVFIFVKSTDHLWIFALINSLSLLLSALSMWLPLRKVITRVDIKLLKPFKHLKGTLILFLPTIAVSIYTILDKTLIGVLITETYEATDINGEPIIKKVSDLENGYYEQSEKIVKMLMTIITAIGIVMIPRNSNEYAQGNIDRVRENVSKTARLVLFIGLPMALGLFVVSDLFVPWFFGPGYSKCSLLLKVLAPLIVIIGLSNVFGLQFLIPTGNDKKFTIALTIGAAINLSLNILFIKLWWSLGAAIATIIAEMCVTVIMCIMSSKDIKILSIFARSWKYCLSGAIMFIPLLIISRYLTPSILNTFILVFIGMVLYFVPLLLLKDDVCLTIIKFALAKAKAIFYKQNNNKGN